MNIHEYQAKEILANFGLRVLPGKLCFTPVEVEWAARDFGDNALTVVKAQIHSGGRGKAGGVKLAKTPEEAKAIASQMFGKTLVTNQTGPEGKVVTKVLLSQGVEIIKEYYLSLVINRPAACINILVSPEGGMDIEEAAEKHPERIFTVEVEPLIGFYPYINRKISAFLGLSKELSKELETILRELYTIFMKYDCSVIELNPLAVTKDNHFTIVDCKIAFDDNALFRHPEIYHLRDINEENTRDLLASRFGLNYIALQGNIGCVVNGAGLAMATMDIIKQYGGEPANFLDVGGGADEEAVTNAFKIIMQDPEVHGIFVNIFGGIMKCDVIAHGIINATKALDLKVPMVVLLEGTNADLAKQILRESKLNIISATSLTDAASRIVKEVVR